MQVADKKFSMKTDGFLPRNNAIECFHKPGNHLFGIKFRISPVIYEKKINFSEYKGYIFPLSYLLDQQVIDKVKKAKNFEERIAVLSKHYLPIVSKNEGSLKHVDIVSRIIDDCYKKNDFSASLEKLAIRYSISLRTLQRYFETCTGIGSKQALQVMRIRKAVAHLVNSPCDFDHALYDYYDQSHFYKHLKTFLSKNTLKGVQPHLKLLALLHKGPA
jgi:AraC-like DNA-binding protein